MVDQTAEEEIESGDDEVPTASEDSGGNDLDEIDPHNLRWTCVECNEVADEEGSPQTYLKFCRYHPKKKGCKVCLLDISSGALVASNLRDAQLKGIFPEPQNYLAAIRKNKKYIIDETPADKKKKPIPREGQPLYMGFFNTEHVPLSSRLFLLRELFIQEGLIPSGTTMSSFLEGLADALLLLTGRKVAIVEIEEQEQELQEGDNAANIR